jgi:hypothetical protein
MHGIELEDIDTSDMNALSDCNKQYSPDTWTSVELRSMLQTHSRACRHRSATNSRFSDIVVRALPGYTVNVVGEGDDLEGTTRQHEGTTVG